MATKHLSKAEQAYKFYREIGVGKWACRACANLAVGSNQYAATIRSVRELGADLETRSSGWCDVCNRQSSSSIDSLRSLERLTTSARQQFSEPFTRTFKRVYPDQRCAICLSASSVEIDHRNPETITYNYTIADIDSGKACQDLQYLCKSCNTKKREHCTKRCKQSDLPPTEMRRGTFYDLKVYAMGDERYDVVLDCLGCPYFEPENTKQLVRIAVAELQKNEKMIFNASIELLIKRLGAHGGESFTKTEMYALIRELKLSHFNSHWLRLNPEDAPEIKN